MSLLQQQKGSRSAVVHCSGNVVAAGKTMWNFANFLLMAFEKGLHGHSHHFLLSFSLSLVVNLICKIDLVMPLPPDILIHSTILYNHSQLGKPKLV